MDHFQNNTVTSQVKYGARRSVDLQFENSNVTYAKNYLQLNENNKMKLTLSKIEREGQ